VLHCAPHHLTPKLMCVQKRQKIPLHVHKTPIRDGVTISFVGLGNLCVCVCMCVYVCVCVCMCESRHSVGCFLRATLHESYHTYASFLDESCHLYARVLSHI